MQKEYFLIYYKSLFEAHINIIGIRSDNVYLQKKDVASFAIKVK
ncbi:hypothetical protein GCM10027028_66450 [Streptomyces sundarbansensis]